METISRSVGDLNQNDRSALERVIGHSLDVTQEITIQINDSSLESNGQAVVGQLPAWCNVYEGLTDEQVDELDRSIVRHPGSRVS